LGAPEHQFHSFAPFLRFSVLVGWATPSRGPPRNWVCPSTAQFPVTPFINVGWRRPIIGAAPPLGVPDHGHRPILRYRVSPFPRVGWHRPIMIGGARASVSPIHRFADSQRCRFNVSPSHRFTDSPFSRFTVAPVHRCADPPCRRFIVPPFRRFAVSPIHRFAGPLFRRFTVSPIHRFANSLFHRFTVSPCWLGGATPLLGPPRNWVCPIMGTAQFSAAPFLHVGWRRPIIGSLPSLGATVGPPHHWACTIMGTANSPLHRFS
jgi:hypothetical protein